MSNRVKKAKLQANTLYWIDLILCCAVSYGLGCIVKKVHSK